MKFIAEIKIMPLKELLDPQGKAVSSGLKNMGVEGVSDVRIGKHIFLELDAKKEENAREIVEKACKNLLANPIMESFSYEIRKV